MNSKDRDLGMDRPISRRDLLHGIGAVAASTMVPGRALADQVLAQERSGDLSIQYPPSLSGLRGDHTGSFEVAHQLAREGKRNWGDVQKTDSGDYDLVVVGAGISGLASAYFWRKQHPGSRVLILDNHDDFGGHAKRNEFQSGGRTLIGYGGSQTLEEPFGYSGLVKEFLRDIGVDLDRLGDGYDQGFYKKNQLSTGIYFDRENWGVDRLIPFDLGIFAGYLPIKPSDLSAQQAVSQMPISAAAQREFVRLLTTVSNQLPGMRPADRTTYLETISYRKFLTRHLNIREPEVFAVLQDLALDSGLGIEATPASFAIGYSGLPGWEAAGLPDDSDDEPYIHHFPDGNASIARLLMRALIPEVAGGRNMDDVATSRFHYAMLDQENSQVRIRLNSTVVQVQHDGDPHSTKHVNVTYVRGGKAHRVRARACVLACHNAIIPALCPELPSAQRVALSQQVKVPILYTNVALRDWRAWKTLGIGAAVAPGSYHTMAMLDFPVSIGEYSFAEDASDPVVVHMERFPHRSNSGQDARDQFRAGRHELLATPFVEIERNVREQLAGMLAQGGFDPARDIEAVTVNRWAHGYAYNYNPLFDPVYDDDDDDRYPHVQARKPFGHIAIANADAAASALLPAAVEQGYRAVQELAGQSS